MNMRLSFFKKCKGYYLVTPFFLLYVVKYYFKNLVNFSVVVTKNVYESIKPLRSQSK